jgi:glutaredoxin-like protein NrdH
MALQHVAGKNKGHIVLYALSTCPWCKKTKKLLEDMGVDYYFGDVDLMTDAEPEYFLPDYGSRRQ